MIFNAMRKCLIKNIKLEASEQHHDRKPLLLVQEPQLAPASVPR